MLQRIYATAFLTKEDLDNYLHFLEEAEKRDHRKLGTKLDLFSVREEIGGGLVLWHPNLAVVREEIENYWRTVGSYTHLTLPTSDRVHICGVAVP